MLFSIVKLPSHLDEMHCHSSIEFYFITHIMYPERERDLTQGPRVTFAVPSSMQTCSDSQCHSLEKHDSSYNNNIVPTFLGK